MKKHLKTVATLVIVGILCISSPVYAANQKFIVENVGYAGAGDENIYLLVIDSGTPLGEYQVSFTLGTYTNEDQFISQIRSTIVSFANGPVGPGLGYSGVTGSDVIIPYKPILATVATSGSYNDLLNLPVSPSSYQTIVSQTGTSAPAVSGGMTPVNSYSGTTFTWARTGAGVYTITASQAVFNTSGKTGVFIAPLQNLNASVKGVVTSSTVVTITTGVQSVAILGLLGLTATPTDVLLSQTMIYIQTYP